ncbi:DUF2254 domain-containing protein [Streptomyces sp. NBC_01750]|uniref:DUF2254 domain-containing protein n=1 Tax=Streptomyces sp. NBC_01750 TaxID=2975928 RepID=UPI002DDAA64A|nr:DUF2254 domain-containing protein [Streptomyces sp. NBC_01750]WSD37963.1 DUF2254 domain-containing protein [Streptomyces sp. NBC_01750]
MMSWASAFRLRQYAKASLWIVPLFGLVLGVVLAECAMAAERTGRLSVNWQYSATTASGVLTAIVGAMVALLGFVVTIGVLVVQQATGTLSPRYMRLWYRDRLQKAVLATFTGTFAFAFSLLRRIESDSVPDLGVTLAGVAVSVSLLLLLVYLNRFTHNLRPVAIADLVGRMGTQVLTRWSAGTGGSETRDDGPAPPGRPVAAVRSRHGGVIQAINVVGLTAAATRHDCTFVVTHQVGDFVPPGATLVEVHGGTSAPDPRLVTGLIALGTERTIEQDPAFALRVLVDIAIRALSPAVNDPTTAVQVLNHIEAFLHNAGRTGLSRRHVLGDERGRPRLVVPGRVWEDYLQLAVTEIREYGAGSTQICRRLRALLEGLLDTLPAEHLPAVRAELGLLDESVEREFTDPFRRATARTGDSQGIGGGQRPKDAPPG